MFERIPSSLIAIIAVFVTLAVAVIGGAYKIGYDNGAKDYETVADFKAKLPGIMENLSKLTGELSGSAEIVDENKRLIAQVSDLKKKVEELPKLKGRIAELDAQIAGLFPADEIKLSIPEGTAERIIPNALTVGVSSIATSSVEVVINGYNPTMHVGDHYDNRTNDRVCRIELVKIAKPNANFVVSCFKNN